MPRAVWSGSISFGLVNVPVRLYSATEPKDVRFHQFEKDSGRRIRYRRVPEGTDREVDYDDVVKGYEVDDGTYVMVSQDELASVEPGQTRTIDIEDFVELTDIDPIYYEKSYYLAPDRRSEKPFSLLREAMDRSGKVAIGRFVLRTKQHLAAIRPSGPGLVLETMFFGDEIRAMDDLDLPEGVKLSDEELRTANRLIESLTVEFDPSAYEDTYRDQVLELIEQKAEGEEVTVERAERPAAPVEDLMAALEASVTNIREARSARRRRGGGDEGGDRARRGDGRAGGSDRADLGRLSKDELYERASAKEISGRSKMSKDQLIDALREAS